MQALNAGFMIHKTKRIAVEIQGAAFESRPRDDADANQPTFEPCVAPFPVGRIDWIIVAVARIELAQ